METLRLPIILLMIFFSTQSSLAQQPTAWQNAFYKSYEAETNEKYTAAIN